jgi:hypothetical protein
MTESVLAKNMFGVKSYYDLDVISKSKDESKLVIKTWNGLLKTLKLDEKEKCYIVESEE